ncbi:MAG: hypothetical protein AAF411_16175, partial [Myxococcota bacterium]
DTGDSGLDAGETDPCDAPGPSLIIVSPEDGQDFPGPSGRTVPVRWAYTGTATEFEVVMTYERAEPPVMARVSREAGCFSSWSTPSLEAETVTVRVEAVGGGRVSDMVRFSTDAD